jgi:multiple sugar transport system substrate-binding protein
MLGGTIIKMKDGHPTKGSYWFPAYNSTEGAKTLEFFKRLVSVVVKPLTIDFEKDFGRRKYAIIQFSKTGKGRTCEQVKSSNRIKV